MKKHYLLLIFCFFSFISFGQLRARQEVDRLFVEWENNESPGAAIGIIKEGQLIYSKSYGIANLDYGIPITNDSKFYIASTTKQFTAACIALLSIEGKIGLDDNIRNYLPEIPDYGKEITIRHLVHHTSGVRDYLVLMYLAGESFEDYFSIGDGIKKLAQQKALNFSPGEKHQYSNSGYMLLAEIVNRTSGMTIRQYAEKNIFQPLGMKNTFFNDDHKQITKDRVISYHPQDDGNYKRFLQNFDALGDGNLLTTVNDLFLWDQNFYSQAVGGKHLKEIMHSRGVLNNGDTLQYAFGLIHDQYKGLKIISHSGGMLGFNIDYIRFPEQSFSVIVLANRSDAQATQKAYQIADIFLQNKFIEKTEQKEIKTDELAPTNIEKNINFSKVILEDFVGNFYSEELDVNYKLTLNEGKLKIQMANYDAQELTILDDNSFTTSYGFIVRFNRSKGLVNGFDLDAVGETNLKFKKNPK